MPSNSPPAVEGALPSRATGRTGGSGSIADTNSPQRRRPRVDSDVSRSGSVAPHQQLSSNRPSPKRFKFGAEDPPNSNMSTKMKGKLPEVIDLTQSNSYKPYTGAKKLVIKNLRPTAKNEQLEQYYKRTEQELLDALQDIFNGRKPQLPLERLYRAVEDICRRGSSNDLQLYETLRRKCEEHLTGTVLRSIKAHGGNTNVEMLRSVLKHWRVWNGQIVS